MADTDKQTEEAVQELKANVREQEEQESLFQEKVTVIGKLHTKRALLANRLGALKSEAVIRRDSFDDDARSELAGIEKTMRGISKDITEFSPGTMDELKSFESEIESRFESVEASLDAVGDKPSPDAGG